MLSLLNKVRSSVALKLSLPVVFVGISTLLVVFLLEFFQAKKLLSERVINELSNIIDTLSTVAEIDSSDSSLRRVVYSLAANSEVDELYLIRSSDGEIIASHSRPFIGQVATNMLPHYEAEKGDVSFEDGVVIKQSEKPDHWRVIRPVSLINLQTNRMDLYFIYIVFNQEIPEQIIYSQGYKINLFVLFVFLLGGVLSIWVQKRYVANPIKKIANTILNERSVRAHELIEIESKDEIGLLATAYNQFILSDKARSESLKINTDKLNEAKIAADQANRSKSDFLASMSHEIRTPMNGVIGMLNLLEKTQLNVDQRHKFRLAKSSADSLLTLINDILDFSKIEAGKLELEAIDFDLAAMMGELAEAMGLRAEEHGLILNLDLSGVRVSRVKGDPTRIRQIMTNLINNAIKFTETGAVDVCVQIEPRKQGGLRLLGSVKDSGIGITSEKLALLFDAFTQEDASTTRKYGGTGLGLAICKLLCELMQGTITASSQLGVGSRFDIDVRLEPSDKAEIFIPEGDLQKIRVIIASTRALRGIENQCKEWALVPEVARSFEELNGLLDICMVNEIHTAVLMEHSFPAACGMQDAELLDQLSVMGPINYISMRRMSDTTNLQALQAMGYMHSFPLPATKYDLIKALEIVTGVKQPESCEVALLDVVKPHRVNLPKVKLLLVEDNHVNQEVALGLLEDLPVEVSCSDTGLEAIKVLFAHRGESCFELVLMDCQMPDMDGYECTRLIRQGEAGDLYKDIPIIALTANAMQGDKERCLAAGMSDYMSKPIEFSELERVLAKWSPHSTGRGNEGEPSKAAQENDNRMKEIDELVIWDKAQALERVRGKPERLVRLTSRFTEDIHKDMQEYHQAVQEGDFSTARRAAHTIKGVAAHLSAERFKALAFEAEMAAEKMDTAALSQFSALLDKALAELTPCIEAFLAEHAVS